MNIRHLKIFKTVCETGSVTKAAAALFMTQPAVSHAIGQLEEEFGTALFDRIAKKLYLTECGRLYLEKAARVLELYEELASGRAVSAESATLRIGSSITIANFQLPILMKAFAERHPHSPVKITVASAKSIKTMLLANEIDLGFVEGVITEQPLLFETFSSYRLAAFCAPDHPFARRKGISLAELCEQKLLLREKGSAIRDVFDSALLLHHQFVEPIWTSVNSQALIQAAKHNLGITILPEILVKSEEKEGKLKKIALPEIELKNENHVVFHRDKFLTGPMQTVIELAKQNQRMSRKSGAILASSGSQ